MISPQIWLRVPATPSFVGLLRTTVGAFAAREQYTIEQVDDLRMAAEEAAVQLLRRSTGDQLVLEMGADDQRMHVRLTVSVTPGGPIIDPESFSWTILRALADDFELDDGQGFSSVTLSKARTIHAEPVR